MVSCGLPNVPTIPNIFKYKLYKSLSNTNGLPTLPIPVITPEDMFSLSAIPSSAVQDRPVELQISEDSLTETDADHLALALESLIDFSASADDSDVTQGVDMHTTHLFKAPWLHKLIPELERLAAQYHIGNYVVIRATGEKIFESMPIYARIGMHLLFYGKIQTILLGTETLGRFLERLSIKQGKIYDSPESTESIHSFVKTYALSLDGLLEPDICKYANFNDFFSRKLLPGSRPVQNLADPLGICSVADCRLVVYPTFDLAREFWVKGYNFSVPELLAVDPASDKALKFNGASLGIFRLAPQDYHRFHCPIDGTIDAEPVLIPGQYYTVNPQAINQPSFDVLTVNVRSVLYMTHKPTGKKMAFVAVGALLVGSIVWTFGGEDRKDGGAKGIEMKRGDEIGFFKYGGSTIVTLFEKGLLEFDPDLVKTSQDTLETLVQVGESIGTSVKESCHHHH